MLQNCCSDACHNLNFSQIKIERPQRFRIGVFGSLYCFFVDNSVALAHLTSKFSPLPILHFRAKKNLSRKIIDILISEPIFILGEITRFAFQKIILLIRKRSK